MSWYSTQSFFYRAPVSIEERVLIWQSESFDQAIGLAEAAGAAYAEAAGCSMLDLTNCFSLQEGASLYHGVELFSLLRDSDLDPAAYVSHHFGRSPADSLEASGPDADGWFAVRSIIAWPYGPAFEERITGWSASDSKAAVALGRAEALEYVGDVEGRELLDVSAAYRIGQAIPEAGATVWVGSRPDALDLPRYIDEVLNTGRERTGYLDQD